MFIIKNVNVINVEKGSIERGFSVAGEEGRISGIGDDFKAAAGAKVIDGCGGYLMPGLCDAHVHVTATTPDLALLERLSPFYVAASSAHILKAMLMRGFTTVRDAGGADHGLARAVEEDKMIGPRILFCGRALSQTGGHGDMRAEGDQHFHGCFCCVGLGVVCDGVPEVRRAARDQIRKGATHLKIMASGGVSSPTDRVDSTQFSLEEIAAIVEEAKAANLTVMAHAYTARAINRLIPLGVRSIEHGNLLDQESCDLLNQHGAWLTPTLVTYDAIARRGAETGFPAALQKKLDEVFHAGKAALELAHRNKVRMLFGTDLLGAMHEDQLKEIDLLRGIVDPLGIIQSLTVNLAEAMDRTGEFGVIQPDARADLVIYKSNPLDDITVLTRPDDELQLVMKDGKVYKNALG